MPIQKESDQLWKSVDLNIRTDSAVRTYYLRKLHEDTKSIFLESAEAGAARVLELPFVNHASEVYLDDSSSQPVKQPGSSANFGKSANEQFVLVQPQEPFFDIHFRSIFRFIFPKGLGYVRDLDHVAGFVSHGFREKMRSDLVNNREQRIDHVELIGILTQPEPIVYMTDKMPSMEQIKKGTTRKLDAFEEKGLHELFKGEDFFIAQKDNTVRMLGALRATQTCIQCHDTANEYDLLGAFSYTLRTNAAVTQPAPKQPTN
jgi:hypothetical protein